MTEPLLLLLLSFTSPQDFQAPASVGGANGMRFTGSPAARWDCGVCHDRAVDLNLAIRATPATLFTQGYLPKQTYELELTVSDSTPPTSAFSLEILSRAGATAGTLANIASPQMCPSKFEVIEVFNGVAQSVACSKGLTTWRLSWTAPDTDLGSATLYASAVVGDLSGDNTGDRSTAQLLGIPSPSTVGQRSSGCGAPAAALLIPFAIVLARRRKGTALLLTLLLIPALAQARPKAKPKKPADPVTAPIVAPAPAPALAIEPAPVAEPVPVLEPAVEPPAVAAPSPEPTASPAPPDALAPVAVVESSEEFGPSVQAEVGTGFGFRSLAQYSSSFATPLRASMGFPVLAASIGLHPMRLLRLHVLEGLELEAQYQRGWVIGALPLGAAYALPSDGRVTLGYALELGPLTIDPRAVFRVQVGGVEKNFLFDDAWYQSLGGELALSLDLRGFSVFARPQVTKVLDTGTLTETNYGRAQGGLSYGGEAGLSFQFGNSGFILAGTYRWTMTTARWAGNGTRSLGAITSVDQVHQGALSLRFTR